MAIAGLQRSRFLLLVLFFLTIPALAHAEKRVALVIGNSAYRSAARLENPAHDAELIAKTLAGLGFTLVGGAAQFDLDGAKFRDSLKEFGKQLHDADVGLFYYAGHGIQVRGRNYLVPTDANPMTEADVAFDMIDAAAVLRQMQIAGTNLNILILDACRNDPFGTARALALGRGRDNDTVRLRDWNNGNGLAEMKAPAATLIAFSAQPDSVAQDGSERDSPFTAALAETIRKPGLDLFTVFNRVQAEVYHKTNDTQLPSFSTNLIPTFYFTPPLDADRGGTRPPPAPSAPAGPSEAERAWGYTKDTTSQGVLEEFVRRFGDTLYGTLAREKLDELKKAAALAEAARKAEQTKAEQAKTEQAKAAQAKAEQAKAEQAKAEQAKAEQAKAEQAKAEQAKADQAKAEQAKAEQARAEQARVEQAKADQAKAEQAKAEQTKAERGGGAETPGASSSIVIASLPPTAPETKPPGLAIPDTREIARRLQTELARLGCFSGHADGEWTEDSQRALEAFNKNAGTKFDIKIAKLDALEDLRSRASRVCPLVCADGYRAEEDHCIHVRESPRETRRDRTAPHAERDSRPVQHEAPPVSHSAPSSVMTGVQ